MDVVISRCCGLDVHQATVVACALLDEPGRKYKKKVVQTFGTMREDLESLRAWLQSLSVTHVTMEGTGVYWQPVYAMLEEHFDLALVNAGHVKNLPGRKTDVSDAEWLATLLRHGLLRKSFVPEKEIRVIREVSRYRRALVESETTEKNRTIKILEIMGLKLASVASDVFGKSGLAMLRAIADGNASVDDIVQFAMSRLRQKLPELRRALDVIVADHHRMMLRDQLARLEQTASLIAHYDALLVKLVEPYADVIARLRTVPGIQQIAAIEIFGEIGPDLSSFPDEAHFASWAGTCPGMNQSAGKKGNARRRRGNRYLLSTFVECVLAAVKKAGTYLKDKYHRLKARRGTMRAVFAIANKLARAVYRAVARKQIYQDLGGAYLDTLNRPRVAKKLIERLVNLGYDQTTILPHFPLGPAAQTNV